MSFRRLAFLASLLPCTSAYAQVSDSLLFDSADKFINPEFSDDARHITFTTVPDSLQPDVRVVMYDELDALVYPIGGAANGRVIAQMAPAGLAYWGVTSLRPETCPGFAGQYSVFLNSAGYFTVVLARNGAPPCVQVIGPDDDPATGEDRVRRRISFPQQDPQSDGLWVVFQVRDRAERKVGTYAVDLAETPLDPIVVDEEKFENQSGQRANAFVHWPWWARGTSQLYYVTLDGCATDCNHRIARLDVSAPQAVAQLVGYAAPQMLGMYPFALGDQNYLYFGLADRPYGIFYEETEQQAFAPLRTLTYDVSQSTLFPSGGTLDIFNVQSMERFEWQGEAYAAYTLSERNTNGFNQAYANQTEIWVTRLGSLLTGEPMLRCRVSENDIAQQPVARTEPEPLVVAGEAYIFYSAGPPSASEAAYAYQWRRIHLGDKAVFDKDCVSGSLWAGEGPT